MPRVRSLCLAGGALVAVVAFPVASTLPARWSRPPAPAAHGAAAAPDPESSQAIAPTARVLGVITSNGRIVDIAVLAVRLRRGDHRLVDVRLRYRLRRGATYRMDPAREAVLVDGSDQLLPALQRSDVRPALTTAVLRRGQAQAGWVTFRRPTAARVVRLQVTLDAGRGPHTGQWRVTPQV
jgi:hypothetical protein